MKLYFIYDVVSSSVARTLTFPSDDTCLRFLDSALKVPNSPFALNVKDTVLVEAGTIHESDLSLNTNYVSNIENEIDVISDYTGEVEKKVFHGRKILGYDDLVKKFIGGKNGEKRE